jgi:hypothetical protein
MDVKRGLSRQDVEDLRRRIPSRDVVAEKQGTRVHHGSIEAAENAIPWLRRRRRERRASA